ncbi:MULTISPECIES: DUF423 domain-containing protein [Xenorhabdus]|uniref:DUF423 domain-containing protein n=1 Tax=Xenorhabdus TaxID=626 RepID=UPI00064A1D9A|nr:MULTISPECIES: DUF423 domain-containing protein [Xenorhabdus]KLU14372.1 hypothetical protein AAY47_16695 [Xenorhabdus griffiniae]KOP33480.1 hypothetical protein AFK69_09655 [Xenorhabdus sp. GDc328]WFQ78438.1 DUF423 domain-containing protein [Xenorhabdus sp. SF857]
MSSRIMLILVGISGFFYVALGAMGAHMLAPILTPRQMEWIHTGLQYQGLHTLAMMALAALLMRQPVAPFGWSGIFFTAGIVLFSGSLYCLAFLPLKFLVYLTPIGGFCFLIGWLCVLIGALRLRKSAPSHE